MMPPAELWRPHTCAHTPSHMYIHQDMYVPSNMSTHTNKSIKHLTFLKIPVITFYCSQMESQSFHGLQAPELPELLRVKSLPYPQLLLLTDPRHAYFNIALLSLSLQTGHSASSFSVNFKF